VIRTGFAANNRLDYDALFVFYEPSVEIRLMGGATRIDLDPVYWGHEGLRKVNQDWRAGFEQFQFEPREVIDPGGDRFGILVDFHGQTSGMATRQRSGFVLILRDGLAMRQDFYWDWEEAVEALVTPARQAVAPPAAS
jgi:ketosteroid isomerase-like protein